MNLKLYNTLTRKKETFKSIKKGVVGMYSCGPTVYWYQHIGNLRTYIFSDILRRILEYNHFKVKHVINVTDVGHLTSDSDSGEDKMELASKKEGKKASEIANYYFNVFKRDLEKLNILMPWKWTKATEHIEEQIDLIKKLVKKGFTYKTQDGIYFDSSKFNRYDELGRLNLKELRAGKRVDMGEKRNKNDFALWKFSLKKGKRQQEWDSPWGLGFPGWHIECSAMSMKYLGNHFDIHTGGEDHVQIHHTNEIAQSECASGEKFVNYWVHGAFLLNNDGKKISKSKGGLFTISELENLDFNAIDFRYLNLMVHYRRQMKFSLKALKSSKNSMNKLKRRVGELRNDISKGNDFSKEYRLKFLFAINDDMNMSSALEILWKVIYDKRFESKKKIKLLEEFDSVFGLGISGMEIDDLDVPLEIKRLLDDRKKYRLERKWDEADAIRITILEKGWKIEDAGKGVRVRKIK